MTKRPWTPGPWNIFDTPYTEANTKLSLKAPEMAELLIELASRFDTSPHYGMTVAETIALKAKQLLKEVGYEVD